MWNSNAFIAAEKRQVQEAGKPQRIEIGGNAVIVLPDGTEIEIRDGLAVQNMTNAYLDKAPEKKPYFVTVTRPSGHRVNLTSVDIQTIFKPIDGETLLKFKKPAELLEDPFFREFSLSDFRFILSDTGEVLGSLLKYGGKKSSISE